MFDYKVILKHENRKYDRELNVNNYDSAVASFFAILKGVEDTIGNFELGLYLIKEGLQTRYYFFEKSL